MARLKSFRMSPCSSLDSRFINNYIISDTELAVVKDRLVREGSVLVGESTLPCDLEESAPPSHKRKLRTRLKLANQDLESGQATTSSSIPVEAKHRKEVEDLPAYYQTRS